MKHPAYLYFSDNLVLAKHFFTWILHRKLTIINIFAIKIFKQRFFSHSTGILTNFGITHGASCSH